MERKVVPADKFLFKLVVHEAKKTVAERLAERFNTREAIIVNFSELRKMREKRLHRPVPPPTGGSAA